MELSPYLDGLKRDLTAAAGPGGPDVLRAADLLGASIEASARMCLLEALSDAAAEITTKLAHESVEVRLRGREAQFVVTEIEPSHTAEAPPTTRAGGAPPAGTTPDGEPGDLTRITLRLPEGLKEAAERAAAAEAISVNAWLVRAISLVLSGQATSPPAPSCSHSRCAAAGMIGEIGTARTRRTSVAA